MKDKKLTYCTRTHNHQVIEHNTVKLNKLNRILFEYRRVANIIFLKQLDNFFRNGNLNTESKDFYGDIETFLSERYKDVIKRHIDGSLKSYISNRKNDLKRIVNKSSLSDEIKHSLHKVNKTNAWFEKENFLARKIIKHILNKNRFPKTNRINMVLNTKVYTLEENNETKSCSFHIKLKTCEGRGETVTLSLRTNDRFEEIFNEKKYNGLCLNNSIQINFEHKTNKLKTIGLSLSFIKYDNENSLTNEHRYISKTERIAFDFGLKNLFSLDTGDVYGKGFMKKLSYYDTSLQKLVSELKLRNKNYKLRTNKRYNRLVKTIREFIKNETNRCLNRIVVKHKPSVIVMEDLNFQNSDMSGRMNRLVSNCGLSNVNLKLNCLNEEYGIKVEKVYAPYSSQECLVCGFTDKGNRVSRDLFVCGCCGKKMSSDIKSSRTIKGRSLDGWFKENRYRLNKDLVKQELTKRFEGSKFFRERKRSIAQVV